MLVSAPLKDVLTFGFEVITDTEWPQLWSAYIDLHRCLGYRRPFRAHIRYFLTDRRGGRLG